ncbi:shadow of prion protein 2 [Syngnathoides biaculeatus]|uniref:shadow of prion protein 2 n=1 Tax=Syngnathoides biaculeatus TaxID=300417 RepID=UPI002ADDB48C|nr:shadow of prion protein 2 [Syngnathoides biaculeatus]
MKTQASGANESPHQHRSLRVGPHRKDLQKVMRGQQKLASLWLLLLLIVALCPGAHYTHSKRGSGAQKGGKSNKTPTSKGHGLPKQDLKWAGVAAARMLGGTGPGILGRPKLGGSRGHAGHNAASAERYYGQGQTFSNQSRWRAFLKGGAPAHMSNLFLTLGHTLTFLTGLCVRTL